ncbi:MAG: response regulator transcription factor [Culicoidibacterales bacterium]
MQYNIHVVEDEKNLNQMIAFALKSEGHHVKTFFDYQSASENVADDNVHLWLLDIMLDQGSGFDLLEQIRKVHPDMPVIFISARDQEFDRVIGLEKGSDDYITKPFSIKELLLRIERLLKRVYKESDIVVVGPYEISLSEHRVRENEQVIELTAKEFDLLLLFIKNRTVAFDRDMILNRVWGSDYFGSERVVDDSMRRLRKKLPNLAIQTIYGFGYRLD